MQRWGDGPSRARANSAAQLQLDRNTTLIPDQQMGILLLHTTPPLRRCLKAGLIRRVLRWPPVDDGRSRVS